MTFTPEQRLTLLGTLPDEVGSLRESVRIKRLRDRIQLTDEERETLDLNPETGAFNPAALEDIKAAEVKLSDLDRELIAYALIKKEQQGSVPTSNPFVSLIERFGDEISEIKQEDEEGDADE